ncbi:hypothetical protein D3C71_703510 [compost metagenome]
MHGLHQIRKSYTAGNQGAFNARSPPDSQELHSCVIRALSMPGLHQIRKSHTAV